MVRLARSDQFPGGHENQEDTSKRRGLPRKNNPFAHFKVTQQHNKKKPQINKFPPFSLSPSFLQTHFAPCWYITHDLYILSSLLTQASLSLKNKLPATKSQWLLKETKKNTINKTNFLL